jgi:PucR C-terminal helix-turn-helix domain
VTSPRRSAERRFERTGRSRSREGRLQDTKGLVDEIVAAVREHVPAMRDMELAEVRRMTIAESVRGGAAVAERRLPSNAELEGSERLTVTLAKAGVPLDAINRSRRIAVRRVIDRWREQARTAGETVELEDVYALWNWCDAIMTRADSAYRQVEVEAQQDDEDRRRRFLRAVLAGTLSAAETQRRATAYGLLPGARYLALRARPTPEGDVGHLQRAIEMSAGSEGAGVLVANVDGDLWGLASRVPEIEPGQGLVGLGPPSELGGVARSFALAGRALETASAFGLDGVVSIDDVSLRAAILAEDHLGERLVSRYLGPLRELGEFGATLERTVREYLERGMRIDESARALIIHPNTLRHRLDRFQQLTGADLHRTQDVVEVWWALERRRVAG